MTRPPPVILCILDGWGHRRSLEHRAIVLDMELPQPTVMTGRNLFHAA
jgi:bisphosphoglycerate-independent phosphoglycerate mutase (AlkP superfamily)